LKRRLTGVVERLDAPGHDPAVLRQSLAHVAAVNRWLGARRALLRHLPALLPDTGTARLLDAGTASADLPRAILRWARRTGRSVHVTATDVHPQALAVARERCAGHPAITVAPADVLALPYADGSFDVALLSMTLHHLEGDEPVRALRELGRVSRRGVLVGELERGWPNYLGARLLAATLWRRNPLTRHDGPLSVRRAFTAPELVELACAAGLPRPAVFRHPFFRLMLVTGAP
jgi:SAM-dependent methyltransferase